MVGDTGGVVCHVTGRETEHLYPPLIPSSRLHTALSAAAAGRQDSVTFISGDTPAANGGSLKLRFAASCTNKDTWPSHTKLKLVGLYYSLKLKYK